MMLRTINATALAINATIYGIPILEDSEPAPVERERPSTNPGISESFIQLKICLS